MESSDRDSAFGPWLRRRRRTLALTQKALAARAGCSVAAIRKFEHDERRPSTRMARALAAALAVPDDERDAFIAFARAGWADEPPVGPHVALERPWRQAAARLDRGVDPGPEPGALADQPRALGREPELARLGAALDDALAGAGQVVLIAGEAGQGKTALMTAFAARAQEAHADLVVATGAGNAYTGRGDPFLPFRQVLAQLTGEVAGGSYLDGFERERAARLARLMPLAAGALAEHGPHLFDTLLPLGPLRARLQRAGVRSLALPPGGGTARVPSAPPSPEDERLALRAEAAAGFAAIADRVPLLLLLDDLHWLDDSSAELLLHLARVVAGHRMLVLAAFRPAELAGAEADHRQPARAVHELAGTLATVLDLDRADGRAFVDAWLDAEANGLDEGFRAALTRQTAGHPLFTIELLRAMQERGDLVRDARRGWVAVDTLRWDRMPTRTAEALAARLHHLSAASREILRAASVEGETFTAEAVARTLALEPQRAVRVLGTELDHTHRLVAPIEVRRGPAGLVSRYRFRHELIQRFVYEGIDPNERAYLHQAVGEALERLLGDDADPMALARHYELAHAPERAAGHLRHAGDRALKAHALDQAVLHYQAALRHWPDADPLGRGALQLDLGRCQWFRMQLEDARRNVGQACAALEAAGDVQAAGSGHVVLSMIAAAESDHPGASAAAARAVAMMEPLGESAELAAAYSNMGYLHVLVSDFAAGAAWGERAVAVAERAGAASVLPHALFCLGSALPFLDPPRFEEGLALLERSFRLADEQGRAFEASMAAVNLGDISEAMGRHAEARARFAAGLAYAERHQIAHGEQEARYHLWWHAWTHGDWSEAFARVAYVRSLVEAVGSDPGIPYAVWLARSDLDLGRAEQARDLLDRQPYLRDLARPSERLPYLSARLRIARALGDPRGADRAAVAIGEAVTPTPPVLEYDAIAPLLEAFRHLVRMPAEDRGGLDGACRDALGELERRYGSPEARAALDETHALTVAAEGQEAEAADLWLAAAERWQAGAFPLREARARAAAARALEATGRHAEARAARERARELLAALAEQVPAGELRASFARVVREVLEASGVESALPPGAVDAKAKRPRS